MKRNPALILFVFALLEGTGLVFAQSPAETTSSWKGFEKIDFPFENTTAYYIKPKQPLPGNPWVWRAHFPGFHAEMDSLLVARGFHLAYVNTNNLFGHPKAMQVWDKFYRYLTMQKNFAPRVALEAISRGGLYAYGWAKRNPDKVACIYAEAPVCDPRSWPGGKGKGQGSPKDWQSWLELNGLTETTANDFKDSPLDDLEGMAAFKIPVLHVVSLQDKIVPPEENTFPLIEKYMRLGGPAAVYPMSRGKQTLEGHHFVIEHIDRWADFIQQHSVPVEKPLARDAYVVANRGLGAAFAKFENSKEATVAFLGGSITHNPGWRNKTAKYLGERFPETKFTFIAAGIPSLGSTPHAFRFGRDVLTQGTPDLLFVESAVNDRSNGFSEEAQVRALEGILQQAYAANPAMNIVMMAFADPDKFGDYDAGRKPVEVEVHRKVAAHYGAAFIDLSQEVYDRVKAGEFSWEYDFKNLHPSPYGQEVYFQTIKYLLQNTPMQDEGQPAKLPAPLNKASYNKAGYHSIGEAKALQGFSVDPSWKPDPPKSTREGFVNVPMLVGERPGDSFEFTFTGRAVGLALISGPDAGVISYQIDGKKPQTLDLFTQWSTSLHLPWYLVLDNELKPGKHKLKLTIADTKNPASVGTACRIVHLLVNE
ncbi:SGNH/GDSL hydrolase family protein [Persicitalea jodogahamensis]|uniref:SGNH hydrolase-type esterase domain-containing protein n=1 Tax=Persicitalea jodogahamensis TaxID=402147 RepID=A0A8J3D8L9_9BACT|nr:SGNH/GDSL hydrolase family protein [Persicitalea jodogahamensis]GHB68955.1 hypothetical protein GCM10007390_23060 [Persicitalea jodogahamensis]